MSTSANPPDLLLFEPVPQRRVRANGWSAEVQRAFIDGLARTGVVARAARSVGKSARSAYALRDRDGAQDFSRAWDQAMRCARDAALGAARDHLMAPERVPVLYRGRIVGWRERVNDRVLIAALRAIHARSAPPPALSLAEGAARAAERRREAAAERKRVQAIRFAEARHRYGAPALWPDDLREQYARLHGRASVRLNLSARGGAESPPRSAPPQVRGI
ncbi:hypothetical protein [Stakelama marina]|uniref:Uncharacterized protein n=1 Tax=Stakelama marina TaxID=2826939 RepID=A0A8T4IBC2_9SPHN|nr:hypothetical protein [Stakelama marina]MBR0551691.1 hypothetical protein [Stakelama marina]